MEKIGRIPNTDRMIRRAKRVFFVVIENIETDEENGTAIQTFRSGQPKNR